jgi:hypothetical protein
MAIKPPCYKCDERRAECHPNCEKYREWKSVLEHNRAVIREKKEQEKALQEHQYAAYRKNAKRRGKKV